MPDVSVNVKVTAEVQCSYVLPGYLVCSLNDSFCVNSLKFIYPMEESVCERHRCSNSNADLRKIIHTDAGIRERGETLKNLVDKTIHSKRQRKHVPVWEVSFW